MTLHPRLSTLLTLLPIFCASPLSAAQPAIVPTEPPTMAVKINGQELKFDPPQIEIFKALTRKGELPDAPEQGKKIGLTPTYDKTNTHILGSMFRTFRPETLVVASESDTPYKRDVDFTFDENSGSISNKDGLLQGKIKAQAEGTLQRLDLIQSDSSGKFSVKKGTGTWVCPELPQPDPGHSAVAGIYIAPWRAAKNPFFDKDPKPIAGATEYAITANEIIPISSFTPAPVAHPERLQSILKKLRDGATVKIAFMGDSITLGAESTRWWDDKYDANSKTWKGRVIHGLRQRFPKATIEVIEAYKGGVTIDYGLEKLPEVAGKKPDLVFASFGVNDAAPNVGKKTPDEFNTALGSIMDELKKQGSDILFITPFPLTPWVGGPQSSDLENRFIPAARKAANEHGAAIADLNADYKNLNQRGIPWWSQNHNWHNHPGDLGHQVYAETVLRCFPE